MQAIILNLTSTRHLVLLKQLPFFTALHIAMKLLFSHINVKNFLHITSMICMILSLAHGHETKSHVRRSFDTNIKTSNLRNQEILDKEQNAITCRRNTRSYGSTGTGLSFAISTDDKNSPQSPDGKLKLTLPTENSYIQEWGGWQTFFTSYGTDVRYLRNAAEFSIRSKQGNCANPLDVLSYIMNKVNKRNKVLMIGYGQLIHLHREKDFMNKTTLDYFDDDFDLWATFDTIAYIGGELEQELFEKFGWSMRLFINSDGYLVLMQIIAMCGHTPVRAPTKAWSKYPAIELNPLPIVTISKENTTKRVTKDLWDGSIFDISLMYPPKCINLYSVGRKKPIPLQIPHKSVKLLNCLYGDWTVKSSNHAMTKECYDDLEVM